MKPIEKNEQLIALEEQIIVLNAIEADIRENIKSYPDDKLQLFAQLREHLKMEKSMQNDIIQEKGNIIAKFISSLDIEKIDVISGSGKMIQFKYNEDCIAIIASSYLFCSYDLKILTENLYMSDTQLSQLFFNEFAKRDAANILFGIKFGSDNSFFKKQLKEIADYKMSQII